MIYIKDINNEKDTFDAFLINIHSIPNFMKIISSSNVDNEKKISKNAFENYVLDKKIELYYSFEECEYILSHNLEKENNFIIVIESFFEKMKLNLNDLDQKYVIINIDKNNSSYSIKFPLSNKSINFIELVSGIYQFNRNNNYNNQLVHNKSPSFLEKIKSKDIVLFISSFFKDKNYLLKIIKNSKNLQQKLNINLSNYKEIYANNRIHYEDFLWTKEKEFSNTPQPNLYDDLKSEALKNQINDKDIKIFAKNYFTSYYNNLDNKEDSLYEFSQDIDFTSPFFDTLSNTKIFNKIFNIKISTKVINENKLKETTKLKFKELNNSKIEYQSIIFYPFDKNDINMIKELNIDFSKLKKFAFLGDDNFDFEKNFNFMKLIKPLNINNNLVYFEYQVYEISEREPS